MKFATGYKFNHADGFISFDQLVGLAINPPFVQEKSRSGWFMTGELSGLRNSETAKTMLFTALVADIENGMGIDEIVDLLGISKITNYLLFASASCKPDDQRYKVIMPLSEPVPELTYRYLQAAIIQLFNADESMERPDQITYKPAITPINEGSYQFRYSEGMSIGKYHSVYELARVIYVNRRDEARKETADRESRRAARQAQAIQGQINIPEFINSSLDWHEELLARGYKPQGNGRYNDGTRARSFMALSKGWLYCKASNHHTYNNGRGMTLFDFIKLSDYQGDFREAVKGLSNLYRTREGLTITEHNQRVWKSKRDN